MKNSNRRRTAITIFALATTVFGTGCITEINDADAPEPEGQLVAGPAVERITSPKRATLDHDGESEGIHLDTLEGPASAEQDVDPQDYQTAGAFNTAPLEQVDLDTIDLPESPPLDELAGDIVSGQLTEREAVLVALITALDDEEPADGWYAPVIKAVRIQASLPDVNAEEADFIDPGAPYQH